MTIVGLRVRQQTTGSGQFFCPNCEQMTAYTERQVIQYWTLASIPLFQRAVLGECIRCDRCQVSFHNMVIHAPYPHLVQASIAAARRQLTQGVARDQVEQFLRDQGADEPMARVILTNLGGPQSSPESSIQISRAIEGGAQDA